MAGWRSATLDADLHGDRQEVFRDVQGIKERLRLNVEFVRPEHFVPPLAGSADRHRFIERIGAVDFYHYDPYAQLLSKIVRGFGKDLEDARDFVKSGWVDAARFRALVEAIPEAAWNEYPTLTRAAVLEAVDAFLADLDVPQP